MFEKFIWQGAEIPSNKKLLINNGVDVLGVGFRGLRERVKQPLGSLLVNFPEGVEIHAYPGVSPERDTMTVEESLEFAQAYETFIETNLDRLSSWVEFDSKALGPDWVRQRRKEFYSKFDPFCFRPIWHRDDGRSVLDMLASEYPHVLIPSSTDDDGALSGLLRSLRGKYETEFSVIPAVKPENLRNHPYTTIYTQAWISTMKYGETIVWANNRLIRYPKKMKDEARSMHPEALDKAGVDPSRLKEDKTSEVTRLAIWSLQQLESQMVSIPNLTLLSTPTGDGGDGSIGQTDGDGHDGVDNSSSGGRNASGPSIKVRHPATKGVLPTIGMDVRQAMVPDDDGNHVIKDIPIVSTNVSSMRNCDSCFVSSQCPAYEPQTECAFTFPAEIKTRDQLVALMQAMVEMQAHRVAFARYTEELNGGYPDITVGKELDRLFKLISTSKKMEQNNDFIKVSVERQSSGGVLSALFGERAKALTEQPEPPSASE